MRKLFTLFLIFSVCSSLYSAYLENVPHQLVQPNGEILNVFVTGDEFFRRVHDQEGYSIVQREDGWYCYAQYDAVNDELIPSEYLVAQEPNLQLPMEKMLGISYEKYIEKRRNYFEPTGCDVSGMPKRSLLEDLADARGDSKTTQTMNNIIICIAFSDSPATMNTNHSTVNGMFMTNPSNNLNHYFSEMSYGQLDIQSHFYPQPNGNILVFYRDSNPRSYYLNVPENQQADREHLLLKNAIEWVNANHPIPTSINLDINNDGNCDYITFVVYGNTGNWNDILWPHKWSLFTYNVKINGKRVYDYNLELDGSGAYYFNVGTFCHEGFHVLGAPDLYHYYSYTNLWAVGSWDVMENTNNTKPQSMSAYMKLRYGRWVYDNKYTQNSFPEADINQTYEVYPFYTNDGADVAKPIMHRIPLTGIPNQYTMVEYRKRSGTNYDASMSGEGLLMYRINTSFKGNAEFNGTNKLDEVYLYRPGSSQSSGVYSQGNLNQAAFPGNGNTSFNSTTNPKPCLSNGTAETIQNINNILYHSDTDSYTFFYGDPSNRAISVNPNSITLSNAAGSTGTVTVTSNVVWNVTIPSEATSWLSASTTKGLNNGPVIFTALTANEAESSRSTNVTIAGNGQTFTVTVTQSSASSPVITTTSLPKGKKGVSYNQTLTATGVAPITWSLASDDLPNGLTLSENGDISGAPTTVGTFNFTVKATNAFGSDTKALSITVDNLIIMITTETLPDGKVGTPYNQTLTAVGDAPIIWTLLMGNLPNGLTLSENGDISGTPTTAGTFDFVVQATNTGSDEKNLNIFIENGVNIPENELSKITIYPNPTTGKLTINNGQLTVDNVKIYDVMGRSIGAHLYGRPNATEMSIDISDLPPGVYFIHFQMETGVITRKVVKQ